MNGEYSSSPDEVIPDRRKLTTDSLGCPGSSLGSAQSASSRGEAEKGTDDRVAERAWPGIDLRDVQRRPPRNPSQSYGLQVEPGSATDAMSRGDGSDDGCDACSCR
jgi:hypothetical protein